MSGLDLESVIEPHEAITWAELEGIVVVVDERTAGLHQLNATASIVWQCLDGSSTLREIGLDIADALDEDPDRVLADIVVLAQDLHERHLLAGSPPPDVPERPDQPTTVAQPPNP